MTFRQVFVDKGVLGYGPTASSLAALRSGDGMPGAESEDDHMGETPRSRVVAGSWSELSHGLTIVSVAPGFARSAQRPPTPSMFSHFHHDLPGNYFEVIPLLPF